MILVCLREGWSQYHLLVLVRSGFTWSWCGVWAWGPVETIGGQFLSQWCQIVLLMQSSFLAYTVDKFYDTCVVHLIFDRVRSHLWLLPVDVIFRQAKKRCRWVHSMLVRIMIGCDCTLLRHGPEWHSFFFVDDTELRFQKSGLGLTVECRPRGLVIVVVDRRLVVGERRDEVCLKVVVVERVLKTATSVLLRTVKEFVLCVVIDFFLSLWLCLILACVLQRFSQHRLWLQVVALSVMLSGTG